MAKVSMETRTLVYPMPAFIIGANVDGKANFMTAAWSGIAGSVPPMITVALQHHRHTLKGIKQNMSFTVNVPSVDQVKETDYCGVVSGTKADKVAACGFKVFYGKLESAPMIEQCPVNLECKVLHILDVGSHELVVGRIEETFVSEECLTEGRPDVGKIKPLVYAGRRYVGLGEPVANAFTVKEMTGK
jgi:flavin reductase (DIM6/NTAB) family NADH-FMN oxidoreductase RutF